MSQPAKLPEPSIDEILASIRRSIVPDDAAGKPAARRPRKPVPTPASTPGSAGATGVAEGEPLLRIDCDAARDQENGKDPGEDGWADSGAPGVHSESGTATPVIGLAATAETPDRLPAPDAPLLSPRTTAAVDTAFTSLAHTVLSQNPPTLEDVVRDMLRPMLKAWLDANLPHIVERLVRAEIERVSRRG